MNNIIEELDEILNNLREAQTNEESDLISQYIEEMNNLWEKYSEEMKDNARNDGFNV